MFDFSQTPSFYAIARAHPERRAVVDADGSETSFGELLAQVNAVSHGLRARGLAVGDVVAGVLPNGLDAVIMLLATAQIGLYYVPINWHLTTPEIDYIRSDCDARIVVYGPADVTALANGQITKNPDDRTNGTVMWYTSGTTGFPKGVQRPLTGKTPEEIMPLYAWFLGEVCDLQPGDAVHLVTSPMYHSAPCAHVIFALNMGHTVVIAPRFEPGTILDLIDRYQVDNAMMVPTMFHRMLHLPPEVRKNHDLSSLRQVIHTGAACPIAVKKAIMDWWGPVLYEYYGSTESAIAFAVKPQEWLARPGTVGRAAPTFEAKVLDDNGDEVPRGEPGLLYVKSILGSFQYRKDPAKTAASMRGDWYAPGDIASMDEDGYLFIRDRRTDLIISGGVNIYPAEIEAALLEHPAVADVAVIGVPDEEWGHRVVALVLPAREVTQDELLDHLRPRLARFKHPRVIEFRAELPRTPTGKLSRSKVRADYLAGQPLD
ncbi:long-chain acyl-CoA synthetase [Acrocarpospora pleiomorpha]|uniref:Long-chain acyl-CoA synthetase n=1 Tax=Acrocarpospora pleiomorpha TaxID=90975 RepID=A0A5M3XIU7_9ACTN|nr:AMP-binding protein [Acrocarpospora pleiomorpha]GES19013.1 long-chain acyl-CoA synthetase [Acrocarpospora pleiomorpha]